MIKLINLIVIALFIMIGFIFIKFDLVCEVTANGEKLGYIENKERFEQSVDNMIDEETKPQYHLTFVAKTEEVSDEKVLAKLKEKIEANTSGESVKVAKTSKTTTKSKKVTSRGSSAKVSSKDSTDKTSTQKDVKKETTSEVKTTAEVKKTTNEAKTTTKTSSSKTTKKAVSLNGVKLTVKPISGTITSRFGSRWGRQHTGLDIGAPKGTKIKAAASGTVIFSGYSGAYGNVIKISHGNGIKTYYAHCSKLYAKKGQKVSAGDVIAAVGSTGRSTGNHLHLEIVKDGVSLNPQNYLY